MPRFVILEHDHPCLHWDLMLERGETLRSWRLAAPLGASAPVAAEAIGDHRPVYLHYEGPVSGGRGQVRRWDRGDYEPMMWSEEEIHLRLHGERIRGVLLLRHESAQCWLALLAPSLIE